MNFGEAVENLSAARRVPLDGRQFSEVRRCWRDVRQHDAADLPVDAHELFALCAPRPVFIRYGVPEKGDALWLDQQGSFMAAVAAQPVFRLLGANDLGRSDDYGSEKMPPVNLGLLDGVRGVAAHDGGHPDGPNWRYFIPWANVQRGFGGDAPSAAP